ncbi:NXPE family member 3-like isoform X1 [Labrus bergylta]|uniref:NXPE family member 3-like isoform X1 n=2 Tax=Labrus bergylta TaxID=56723 RepID=UPI0033134283
MTLLKTCVILLLLTVLFFVLRNMDLLQLNYEENFGIVLKKVTSAPRTVPRTAPHTDNFCTFEPLSLADAKEERMLLDSIAWPETPLLPAPFLFDQTSDPAHSIFTILPGRGGVDRHVGDQLEVMVQIYDFQGNPKKSGGDVLLARLHNRALEAGVAGRVVDHLNGSYSAVFPLLWEGSAHVEVTLVHSSEAVTVLHRLNREHPERVLFKSLFHSGSSSEITSCNVCLRQTNQPQCNYSDLRTGEPWFCYKPKKLSCDDRINHMRDGFNVRLKDKEEKLFQSKVNLKVFIHSSGPANVMVLPPMKGQPEVDQGSGKSGLSGYYYQGVWRSLGGTKVHQFNNSSAISQCLKGKVVHMYGDSTVRQWFEYFDASLPDAKEINQNSPKQTGPYMIWDNAKNILVTYRVHGPPLSFIYVPTSELRYIANEIDGLVGGTNTVVVFSVWAHFSPFPIELYIRRLQSIRRAVIRLLNRAPDTLVVIRTANLRGLTPSESLNYSDWYTLQLDKVLRAVFKGFNVRLVDAWEMTLAHHLPHNIHPGRPIVKNMIDILLSYICTK